MHPLGGYLSRLLEVRLRGPRHGLELPGGSLGGLPHVDLRALRLVQRESVDFDPAHRPYDLHLVPPIAGRLDCVAHLVLNDAQA